MTAESSSLIVNFFTDKPISEYSPGELVVKPWDMDDTVLFVESGLLKISAKPKRGKQVVVAYYNPGTRGNVFFGTFGGFRKYSVEALTPVVVRRAVCADFSKFLDDYPEVCRGISLSLATIIKDLLEQIEALKSGTSYQRLASCLYYLARDLGTPTSPGRLIDLRITHTMLAALTGLTSETITVQLKRLRQKNLVSVSKQRFYIPNLEQLRIETAYAPIEP